MTDVDVKISEEDNRRCYLCASNTYPFVIVIWNPQEIMSRSNIMIDGDMRSKEMFQCMDCFKRVEEAKEDRDE